jgi:hypothetical protein
MLSVWNSTDEKEGLSAISIVTQKPEPFVTGKFNVLYHQSPPSVGRYVT